MHCALAVRFHDNPTHPDKASIKEQCLTRDAAITGNGLHSFTVAILNVETGYLRNSPANIKKFTNTIIDTFLSKDIDFDIIQGR